MSYDIDVFLPRPLTSTDLADLVTPLPGLAVGRSDAELVEVVSAGRGEHRFAVEGPFPVEPEDLPEGLRGRLLGVEVQYSLHARADVASAVRGAQRLARSLAKAHSGGTWDLQTGTGWAPAGLRRAARPQRKTVVDLVELTWYARASDLQTLAAAYVETAARVLPEALPRRFGAFEPLGHRFEEAGAEAFVRFTTGDGPEDAGGPTYFKTSFPFTGGSVSRRFQAAADDTTQVVVRVVRGVLEDDERWLEATRRLFTSICQDSRVVLATGEVSRTWRWQGSSVWGPESERTDACAGYRTFWGAPAVPVWWLWCGPEYAELLRPHLPADQVTEHDGGELFHEASRTPADRDDLGDGPIPTRFRQVPTTQPNGTAGPTHAAEVLPVLAP